MSVSSGAGCVADAESSPVSGSKSRKSGSVPAMVNTGVGMPVAVAEAPGKGSPTSSLNIVSGVTVRIGVAGG